MKQAKTFILALSLVLLAGQPAQAETVKVWNLSKGTLGWVGNARVQNMVSSADGLSFRSVGIDPWIEGPGIDLDEGKMVRVTIRMKSTADKSGELFYGRFFQAGKSVQFVVRDDGKWHDYSMVIKDTLGKATRFRFDPCAGEGEISLAYIKVETIDKVATPTLEKPVIAKVTEDSKLSVSSGKLVLRHDGKNFGGFVCEMGGQVLAGNTREVLGVVVDGEIEWLNLKDAIITSSVTLSLKEIVFTAIIKDSGGGKWRISRKFSSGKDEESIAVETSIAVDKDRGIIHAPWLTVFAGIGEHKTQGLFPGVEYLADEPSSSDADIAKPKHIRRTPLDTWITFPLMAVTDGEHYFGLVWDRSEMVAATFDSPDRVYGSDGHLMSLSGPGVGGLRFENDFAAHSAITIKANAEIGATATIIAGAGKDVTAAIQQYVDIKGLPELPEFDGGLDAAAKLMAHGWLDSAINEDGLVRHAVWGGNFGAGPAADAAMYIDWLGDHTTGKLSERLIKGKEKVLAKLPAMSVFASAVGHVRRPNVPLVFGRMGEYVRMRKQQAIAAVGGFDDSGKVRYRKGKADYGRTHFADHANGLGGAKLVEILEAATLCADAELAGKAISLLDKQTVLYANTVPRGAQTWEMPLHTPDVLASAHMVRAYLLGYLMTGREDLLEQAKYWAWTGVAFVFLDNPTEHEVGDYAIIAVLGATNWQAPVWFGRPVQWCGLVPVPVL